MVAPNKMATYYKKHFPQIKHFHKYRWLNSEVANKPKVAFEIISVFMGKKKYNLEINNVKRLKLGEHIQTIYKYFIGNVLIFV